MHFKIEVELTFQLLIIKLIKKLNCSFHLKNRLIMFINFIDIINMFSLVVFLKFLYSEGVGKMKFKIVLNIICLKHVFCSQTKPFIM